MEETLPEECVALSCKRIGSVLHTDDRDERWRHEPRELARAAVRGRRRLHGGAAYRAANHGWVRAVSLDRSSRGRPPKAFDRPAGDERVLAGVAKKENADLRQRHGVGSSLYRGQRENEKRKTPSHCCPTRRGSPTGRANTTSHDVCRLKHRSHRRRAFWGRYLPPYQRLPAALIYWSDDGRRSARAKTQWWARSQIHAGKLRRPLAARAFLEDSRVRRLGRESVASHAQPGAQAQGELRLAAIPRRWNPDGGGRLPMRFTGGEAAGAAA